MANCIVSTISALADVIEKEFQYKKYRALANKKETLMTQISRVGFNLGSKAADYQALTVPVPRVYSAEPESICRTLTQANFPTTGKKKDNTQLRFLDNDCFKFDGDLSILNTSYNSIYLTGKVTIPKNTTITLDTNLVIVGELIMEENAKLIIKTGGRCSCNSATLNNNSITVSTCSIFNAYALDLGSTKSIVDLECGSAFSIFNIKNTSNSQINIGKNSYGGTGIPTKVFSNWKNGNFGCYKKNSEIPNCIQYE